MFAKKFSWHGPKWYNSFVRRRAWIRKRVKKAEEGDSEADPNRLNPEYFTIQPAAEIRRSMSKASTRLGSSRRGSVSQSSAAGTDIEEEKPDIEDVDRLLTVLRAARIDREKIDAVDNFLDHGQDDLVHLQDAMHEIMSLFVFQASRKVLLTRLTQVYDEVVKKRDEGSDPKVAQLADHLAAAIKHADEEVRKLEFWSDVKAIAENGASRALDQEHGWDSKEWQGLDNSGPAEPASPKL
jgi:hypothetical protein